MAVNQNQCNPRLLLTLKLPRVTDKEFLLTKSIQYQTDKQENISCGIIS